MNKSSTNNSQKPNNYAQAAAQQQPKPNSLNHNPLHQKNQHISMHQQTQQNQHSAVALTSTNFNSSVNGKSIASQQKLQTTQFNSSLSNGNNNTSSTVVKSSHPKKKLMSLPKNISNLNLPVTPIQFGSINIPTNISQSSSPIQNIQYPPILSGGALPSPLPKNVNTIFGTVKAQGSSEELVQQNPIQQSSVNVATASSGISSDASKNINSRIQNEIHRTQSAPPQLAHQDLGNGRINQQSTQQPSNLTTRPQPAPIVQQQSIPASHQHSLPTHHRKDSASSTVSSNDGQIQSYHTPSLLHHSNHNHTNQHSYNTHHRQNPHHKSGGMGSGPGQNVSSQFAPRSRDKSGTQVPITSSAHINVSQPPQVPAQPQIPQHYPIFFRPNYDMQPYYYTPPIYMNPMNAMNPMNQMNQMSQMPSPYVAQQRPPMPVSQPHISTQNQSQFNPQKQSKAIQIINPNDNRPLNLTALKTPKKDEISIPNISETKKTGEIDKVKIQVIPDDKKESKAVKIVAPADKFKEDLVKKEKEEHERKVREETERMEREKKLEEERKVKEEKERKEREEKERKEREEQERMQRKLEEERKAKEEQERKEKEEKERKEREEKQERERILEEERKAKEEKERKEREEKEQREREEAERIERERILEEQKRAKEEAEREEQERKAKEEHERKCKLEEERRAREEAERKEREEKEQKAKEDQERIERERKLGEELKVKEAAERKAKEEKDRQESERKKKLEEQFEKTSIKREEKKHDKKNKPDPLDLSRTTSAPSIPNPLGSARIIDDLSSVTYPSHIKSPNPELNSNSTPGKFKYERGFLMQFMDVCKERPDNLPPVLDAIGRDEPKDNKKNSNHRAMTNAMRSGIQHKNNSSQPPMGEFKLPGKNSEERFNMSTSNINRASSNSSGYNRSASLGPRSSSGSAMFPPSLSNASSHNQMGSGRNSSGGGGKRMDSMNRRKGNQQNLQGPNTNVEPIQPLEQTKDRWVPPTRVIGTTPKASEDQIPMDVVQRKVKALLNKLTLEKFDIISDQIIEYANKSKFEKDGRILREIIRLIFEKSCDEINFSQMYAQLCRKMMEMIDPEITDENVKNNDGKLVMGGTLFRKYLLNRCQEDFEKGWKVNIPVPSNEKGEPDLLSDEYYSAAKAKRRGLGLIRFIGELFKLSMLTERIMHECIRKLLQIQNANEIPGEEEMESLCKLLTTVGKQLDHDHDKAKNSMDVYFNRMDEMSKNKAFSSRIRFMLQDVIDLRNNKWTPRRDNNAPKTISEIHEDAAKQKEEAAETLRRTASSGGRGLPKIAEQMSRGGSGRRDLKGSQTHGPNNFQSNNEGWSTVGAPSRKPIDISKFGSVRGKVSGQVSLGGPTSLMPSAKGWKVESKEREEKPTNMTRTSSTGNMYNVLNQENLEGKKNVENPTETSKSSQATERRRIILAPRTLPKDEISNSPPKPTNITSSVPLVGETNAVAKTSESSISIEVAQKKIQNMVEEYFSVLDINEVLMCVKELPIIYHSKSIEGFANTVLEKKQEDVHNVIKVFKKLVSDNIVKKSDFKEGLIETMNFLVDIGADAPFAYEYTGQLLCGAKMDFKDIPDLFKPLIDSKDFKGTEKVMKGYLNTLKKEMDEQSILKMVNESNFDFKSVFINKPIDINKYLDDF
ncbi:959_t:CDS:2, partial [Entrophospora sp. SA101]